MYIDTSAIGLILLNQGGADSAQSVVDTAARTDKLVSSVLLRIETARLAHRARIDQEAATQALSDVALVSINDDVIERACSFVGELKSLDAIHLATAVMLDDPRDPVTVLTHDARLANAARAQGLNAHDPALPPAQA
ncbi:type II toxin-antitoxin system VapC family toxin [Actinomyces sp. MRS3W]|uniref:type II toxin-antitoxin system VapC family toxin n=1 Tax=Actinomyces sp. MRS3W TaxID=2800796 RepID=UPI0028FD477D|nr:type II toxin-antitoxin system VapC family toxin [Actinomyces sp. MRS3W]MDU0349167.1 type II toxin-antitoxin system VapC family toxin [Actinomyces sp. MRS3W]